MSTYWDQVRRLPTASDAQILDFIEYVAWAHSWYKHLPLTPPGVPFHFFLDPNAGCDLLVERGKTTYRERKKHGFHYSDLPTAEYRQRFGLLQYSTKAGTSIFVSNPQNVLVVSSTRRPVSLATGGSLWERLLRWFRSGVPLGLGTVVEAEDSSGPVIQSDEQVEVGVPEEILAAGRVELTGIIHPMTSTLSVWRWAIVHLMRRRRNWPEETGGRETLVKIYHFLKENPDAKEVPYHGKGEFPLLAFCPEIHALVEPERQRLKKLMEEAIRRVIDLIQTRARF